MSEGGSIPNKCLLIPFNIHRHFFYTQRFQARADSGFVIIIEGLQDYINFY